MDLRLRGKPYRSCQISTVSLKLQKTTRNGASFKIARNEKLRMQHANSRYDSPHAWEISTRQSEPTLRASAGITITTSPAFTKHRCKLRLCLSSCLVLLISLCTRATVRLLKTVDLFTPFTPVFGEFLRSARCIRCCLMLDQDAQI